MIYPVRAAMTVYDLRRDIATMVQAPAVHLLVGDNWAYDLLDHIGTITTRLYPFTNIPCPYLQPRIVVNVFPYRPEEADSPAL
jgi:hypothetical protein